MAYFCYILKCCDGTFYTGWTTDPLRRTKTHNAGRGARYTRTRTPVLLVYTEELPDRTAAMKREIAIKKMDHARKQKLIDQQNPNTETVSKFKKRT
jgi:putative endonuclease